MNREQLIAAFEKDMDQWMINSMTPDREYPVPVDHLEALFVDLERDNAQLRKALKNVTIMVDIGAVVSTDPELDPQIKKTMEAARTALGEGRKPVARSGQTNPATGKSDAAQGQPEGQG